MAKFKFELDRGGVSDLLKSGEMQSILQAKGEGVAARAGDGFIVETKVGARRAYTNVVADSFPARIHTNRDNVLLKALGG